jgi:glycerophosphoryl diester phosphodiesterase
MARFEKFAACIAFAVYVAFATAALAATLLANPASAFDLEAHRGGRALWPENTLPAFGKALSLGVDTLELDLGVSKDGVIVISHDRHLNPDLAADAQGRYVPAPGPVLMSLTLQEIKSYEIGRIRPGSDYAKRFARQEPMPRVTMPTLVELIALVKKSGNQQVRLNIETKIDPTKPDEAPTPERFVDLLLEVLAREGFSERVMIQSFDWRTLQLVQARQPKIPTVYLSIESDEESTVYPDKPSPWTAGFDPMRFGKSTAQAVHAAGGKIWSPFYRNIDLAKVEEAHKLGLRVVVWTVNDGTEMARLIDMGVDGIISDAPDILRATMAAKGMALPRATPVVP